MDDISTLSCQFQSESEQNQLQLIPQLANAGDAGLAVLREFLSLRQHEFNSLVIGRVYQTLYQIKEPETQEFLKTYFPHGVVPLQSERNIDYLPLQKLLAEQDFERADLMTMQKLCQLAGEAAIKRKWLYFTEVDNFPSTDLHTLDRLWSLHSEGRFGYQIQRQIWLGVGKDFTKLWPKIGWKNGNNWTRYPNQFIWDLSAPKGHLPTSNQLRGTKVINSIFCHRMWQLTS